MLWQSAVLTALLAQNAAAQFTQATKANGANFMRFMCSQLVLDRIDPLVSPGINPAPHLHQVGGGNSFNVSMNPDTLVPDKVSTCTSCTYADDFSNYWTASMFFKSPENGTYRRVPQMANGQQNGNIMDQDGGLTVYYMQPFSGTNMKVTQFKPGFRMLAGDPTLRTKTGMASGICHRCLTKNQRSSGGNGAPCQGDAQGFPTTACPGGIRATVIFPSCWDGKNLDSPDHKSHMAYAPGGAALAGDKCPTTHPVRIPQVMYEIMYDTSAFANPDYYKNGKQPLVYSFGDATGFGAHGDYLFGWKGDALQKGMDGLNTKECLSEGCPILKVQDSKNAKACTIGQAAKEDIGTVTWLKELPGSPPVTYE